jgi:hypothetical protein
LSSTWQRTACDTLPSATQAFWTGSEGILVGVFSRDCCKRNETSYLHMQQKGAATVRQEAGPSFFAEEL